MRMCMHVARAAGFRYAKSHEPRLSTFRQQDVLVAKAVRHKPLVLSDEAHIAAIAEQRAEQ
jgi:hypothetical protein